MFAIDAQNNLSFINVFIWHNKAITVLTVLSNGNLASGSDDVTKMIWNPNDGLLVRTLSGHKNSVYWLHNCFN